MSGGVASAMLTDPNNICGGAAMSIRLNLKLSRRAFSRAMLKPYCIRRAVLIVFVLFCLRALSQTSRTLDVIEVDANTPSGQLAQARQSYLRGAAILRVSGGGQQAAEDLLEIPHLGAAAM